MTVEKRYFQNKSEIKSEGHYSDPCEGHYSVYKVYSVEKDEVYTRNAYESHSVKSDTKSSTKKVVETRNADESHKNKKNYKCNICGEEQNQIITHFKKKHNESLIKQDISQKIYEMQQLTGEVNNRISWYFFRLIALAIPDDIYYDIKSEFKDAMSSTTDYHKGKLFVTIVKDVCKKNHIII